MAETEIEDETRQKESQKTRTHGKHISKKTKTNNKYYIYIFDGLY